MKPAAHQIAALVMLLARLLGVMAIVVVTAAAATVYHDASNHRIKHPIKTNPLTCQVKGGTR